MCQYCCEHDCVMPQRIEAVLKFKMASNLLLARCTSMQWPVSVNDALRWFLPDEIIYSQWGNCLFFTDVQLASKWCLSHCLPFMRNLKMCKRSERSNILWSKQHPYPALTEMAQRTRHSTRELQSVQKTKPDLPEFVPTPAAAAQSTNTQFLHGRGATALRRRLA